MERCVVEDLHLLQALHIDNAKLLKTKQNCILYLRYYNGQLFLLEREISGFFLYSLNSDGINVN